MQCFCFMYERFLFCFVLFYTVSIFSIKLKPTNLCLKRRLRVNTALCRNSVAPDILLRIWMGAGLCSEFSASFSLSEICYFFLFSVETEHWINTAKNCWNFLPLRSRLHMHVINMGSFAVLSIDRSNLKFKACLTFVKCNMICFSSAHNYSVMVLGFDAMFHSNFPQCVSASRTFKATVEFSAKKWEKGHDEAPLLLTNSPMCKSYSISVHLVILDVVILGDVIIILFRS